MATTHPMKPGTYTVSSPFGPRWGTNHNGQDFAAPLGTPIYATEDGVIIEGKDRAPGSVGGFGNWIWQDSQRECGRDFIYGHMRHADIYVRKGDRVKAGQMIARVGNEGQSTGPHLHFEEWTPPGRLGGRAVDPAPRLRGAAAPGGVPPETQTNKGGTMARNYLKVEPDRYKLMNKHFTRGRAGQKIEFITIHHNAGVLSIDQIWQVWQTRQASAHYQVTSSGEIGQLVNDSDTAWHAGNQWANRRSIGIEVSNSAGKNADWPITDTAIRTAGRWAAALCFYYKLGRPQAGRSIRFHREFSSTSCPYHLAPGGKYHAALMAEAQRFYDELKAGRVHPDGTPKGGSTLAPKQQGGFLMSLSNDEQRELLDKTRRIHHELTHEFDSRYDLNQLRQGKIKPEQVHKDTLIGYVLNMDARTHDMFTNMLPTMWKAIKDLVGKIR